MEAVNVIYNGDLEKARISEFGFYTGVEQNVDENEAPVEASTGVYEAVYVQLAKKRCTLGTDLSDNGSSMRPYVTFETSCCLEL